VVHRSPDRECADAGQHGGAGDGGCRDFAGEDRVRRDAARAAACGMGGEAGELVAARVGGPGAAGRGDGESGAWGRRMAGCWYDVQGSGAADRRGAAGAAGPDRRASGAGGGRLRGGDRAGGYGAADSGGWGR
jgi:hypothetical protein